MAFALRFFTCLVLMVCVVVSVDAEISCDTVASNLVPCLNYLVNGGAVPTECCAGITNLISMAENTADRQQTCRCLQSSAKSIPGLKPDLASGLPGKCRLTIPYPISLSTNCDNIK